MFVLTDFSCQSAADVSMVLVESEKTNAYVAFQMGRDKGVCGTVRMGVVKATPVARIDFAVHHGVVFEFLLSDGSKRYTYRSDEQLGVKDSAA